VFAVACLAADLVCVSECFLESITSFRSGRYFH